MRSAHEKRDDETGLNLQLNICMVCLCINTTTRSKFQYRVWDVLSKGKFLKSKVLQQYTSTTDTMFSIFKKTLNDLKIKDMT